MTLSEFAGGEFLPLRRSKGAAFPFLLTPDGSPLLPRVAHGQRGSPESQETPGPFLLTSCDIEGNFPLSQTEGTYLRNKTMDDLDRKIVEILQGNGRMPYRDIARKLHVSDGTVRFRVGKLIRRNILKFTAAINPFFLEDGIAALVGMQLEKRTHQETMDKVSQLRGVVSVSNVTGRYDLLVEVFFQSRQDLRRFLVEDLSRIGGINHTETFVYLDAINKWIEAC